MNKSINLITLFPSLAEEWDYQNNRGKKPEDFLPHSNYNANWICKSGHRWQARINNRVNKLSLCPYCSGMKPIPGETDFSSMYPCLSKEWHPKKNGDLSPKDVTAKSNRKVWWLCPDCGFEWLSRIDHRVAGRGCPFCAGSIVIPGNNDLQTFYPRLTLEWDKEKNVPLTPEHVSLGSSKRVWWKCSVCGYSWQTTIQKRVKHNSGCPVCNGKACGPGINDIATLAPALAKEWDYEKNFGTIPQEVALHSNKMIHWKCKHGHEWLASPNNRAKGEGCPYCAGKALLANVNSLAVLKPELSIEWSSEKNNGLTPYDVAAYDNRRYWWKCICGHEWLASPSNRSNGKGCPYCKKKKPIQGKTDFATLYPELAKEWDTEKNKPCNPNEFFPSNTAKRWWVCEKGHAWSASISARVRGATCPVCNNRQKQALFRSW